MSALIEVLDQHRFDAAALVHYLADALEAFEPPARIRQYQGGHSNPTFLIEHAGGRLVLRKQPPGPLLAKAHQIDREFRVMSALAGSGFPVPRMLHHCTDPGIIGTPFYAMSHVDGVIASHPALPEVRMRDRSAVWQDAIRTLARLHQLDWRRLGLSGFGRPDGYAARQIKTWSTQYAASQTAHIPAMDALAAWLQANCPTDDPAAITHGDYRIGNLVLAPEAPHISAVLDWELSTIGHGTADLAYCLMPYRLGHDGRAAPGLVGLDLNAEGLPDEADLVALYAAERGLSEIRDWPFFQALAIFRLAAIVQGVYARALKGNASSLSARETGSRVPVLAEAGLTVIAAARSRSL
ncbi:MAG: phosphotransferase family protein [Hyphomicrobiaceae bacterium]